MKKWINNEEETIGPDAYYDTIPNIAAALWDDECVRMFLTEKKDKKKWDEQNGQDGGKMFLGIDGEPLFYLNSDSPSKGNGGLGLEDALYAAHSRGNVIKGEKLPERSKFKRKSRHKMWKTVRYDSALAHVLYYIEKFREAGFPKPFDYGKGLSTDRQEKELEENERLEEASRKKPKTETEKDALETVETPSEELGVLERKLDGFTIEKLSGNVKILDMGRRSDNDRYFVNLTIDGSHTSRTLKTRDKKLAETRYQDLKNRYEPVKLSTQILERSHPRPVQVKPELVQTKPEPKETMRATESKPSWLSKINLFARKSEPEVSVKDSNNELAKAKERVKELEAKIRKAQEVKKSKAEQEREKLLARVAELDKQISE